MSTPLPPTTPMSNSTHAREFHALDFARKRVFANAIAPARWIAVFAGIQLRKPVRHEPKCRTTGPLPPAAIGTRPVIGARPAARRSLPICATISSAVTPGTYTVTLNDARSITNVTLNNATATIAQSGDTFTVSGAISLLAGTYSLTGGKHHGRSITSAGGTLMLGASTGNILNNVSVGAGVLSFSTGDSSVRFQGTEQHRLRHDPDHQRRLQRPGV